MISPALDPGSTTVEVWLKIDNKAGKLKVGTPVKVSITGQHRGAGIEGSRLRDPDGATTARNPSWWSAATARRIASPSRWASTTATTCRSRAASTPADMVITGGAYGLDEGTKVKMGPGRR